MIAARHARAMPELPEVETIRRHLEAGLKGRRIVAARTLRGDLRRPFPPDLAKRIEGRRIERRSQCKPRYKGRPSPAPMLHTAMNTPTAKYLVETNIAIQNITNIR